jgi:hypothetical protein
MQEIFYFLGSLYFAIKLINMVVGAVKQVVIRRAVPGPNVDAHMLSDMASIFLNVLDNLPKKK